MYVRPSVGNARKDDDNINNNDVDINNTTNDEDKTYLHTLEQGSQS